MVNDFVNKRQQFVDGQQYGRKPYSTELLDCSESENEQLTKPRIEEFLKHFEEKIKEVNVTYRKYKAQFEEDMKTFNEGEIQQEEDLIEQSINEGIMPQKERSNLPSTKNSQMDELKLNCH